MSRVNGKHTIDRGHLLYIAANEKQDNRVSFYLKYVFKIITLVKFHLMLLQK